MPEPVLIEVPAGLLTHGIMIILILKSMPAIMQVLSFAGTILEPEQAQM